MPQNPLRGWRQGPGARPAADCVHATKIDRDAGRNPPSQAGRQSRFSDLLLELRRADDAKCRLPLSVSDIAAWDDSHKRTVATESEQKTMKHADSDAIPLSPAPVPPRFGDVDKPLAAAASTTLDYSVFLVRNRQSAASITV